MDQEDVVKVGPAPANVLLRATADKVLQLLFDQHRDVFGVLVAQAVTGGDTRYTVARARKGAGE